jgi:tetratricopeptide (TPR) repeat protein
VVLLFDDLQWCDESSAAALHYVARLNRHQPLLGVLAGRDGELHDNAAVQQALRGLRHDALLEDVRLGPLAEGSVRRLIEERAPAADSERLARQCAGNPLLAIELARAETAGDSGGSLDELIRERLARFDVEGGEVLQWASVLAPRIDVTSLVRVTGLDAGRVAVAVAQAERQAMLVPAERGLRFSHDLLGRGVYAMISPVRRQVMHRRVAELLEQETALDLSHAADLAHHAALSGDPALAARAMVSAGRLCLRFFANDDALALARRGLQLAEELSAAERVQVEVELHDIALAAAPLDDWETAARRYAALAEQALDHGALSHARLGYQMASYVRWANGHWAGAREQSLQAERVTRSGSDAEHIVGLAETAKCLAMLERDLSQADALLMEAQALADRRSLCHHAIPAALGMLRYHEDHLDEAEERFQEARTLCKSAGDRVNEFQANEYLVMIAFERGQFLEAQERCVVLLAIGERLRDGSEAPFARALGGLCQYALTDDAAPLDAALDDLRMADAKYRLAYTLTRAALLDAERGRLESAEARATEAMGAAQALERATELLLAHLALAQAYHGRGDNVGFRREAAALAEFDHAPVAKWARSRAARILAAVV